MPRRSPAPDLDQALADAFRNPPSGPGPHDRSPELNATTALLAEHGLRNWTVDDVARMSQTARATLYRRYGSRDGLIQVAVTREARRFFQAIADEVTRTNKSMTDTVVDGIEAGLRLARTAPLGQLMTKQLWSQTLLDAATTALADLYLAMTPDHQHERGSRRHGPDRAARAQVEVRAEALVRLAISFLLIPGRDGGGADGGRRLRAMVAPLVEPAAASRFQPAERPRQTATNR